MVLATIVVVKPSYAQSTPTVSIDPKTLNLTNAYVGQTIQLNITVTDVQGLWGWTVQDVRFNPSVLNITNVQEGPFLKDKDSTFFLWASNSTLAFSQGDIPNINCALSSITNVSGTGVLATLTFQVLATGTSPITITQASLLSDSQQMSDTIVNGTVNVAAISTITPSPSSSPATSPNSSSPTPTSSQSTQGTATPTDSAPDNSQATAKLDHSSSQYLYVGVAIIVVIAVIAVIISVRRRK